jgi:hypothetical protein
VNLPFGILAFVIGVLRLKEYQHEAAGKFDPAGFFLSALSLGAILYGLNQVAVEGWSSTPVLLSLALGISLGAALIVVERRIAEPILALRLFRDRVFTMTNITSVFATASFFGLVLIMPLMLQGVRGLSPSESGLTTFPQAIGVILMSQVARKLYPKVGPRRLISIGLIVAGFVMLLLMWTTPETNLWVYRAILFGRGLCWAFVFIPLQAAAFSQIQPLDTGRASALFSTQRQVASSLGIAVLISVLMAQLGKIPAHVHELAYAYNAYKVPFMWTCIFAFLGAVTAFFIDDDKVLSVFRKPPVPSTNS